jgi:hypothetical protein
VATEWVDVAETGRGRRVRVDTLSASALRLLGAVLAEQATGTPVKWRALVRRVGLQNQNAIGTAFDKLFAAGLIRAELSGEGRVLAGTVRACCRFIPAAELGRVGA